MKILITLICLIPVQLFCQPEIDSLLLLAEETPNDTARLFQMTEVAEKLLYNDPVRARKINLKGLEESKSIKYINGIARNLANLSAIYIVQGNYDTANIYIDHLLDVAEENRLILFQIRALNRRSVVQYYRGQFLEGIETNLELLSLASKVEGTKRNELNALNNIGINYERLEEYDKATQYYLKALDLAKELDNAYTQSAISANLGVIHKNSGRLDEAEKLFLESIQLAEEINNQTLLIDELINLADVYIQQEKYALARSTNTKTQTTAKAVQMNNGLIKALSQEGQIEFYQGRFQKALEPLLSSERKARETGDREELLPIYEFLHQCYNKLGENHLAYQYIIKQYRLRDSIFDQEKTAEIDRLEMAYQVAEKDKEILAQELEIVKRTRQRNLILLSSLVIFLVGLLIFYFLRKIIRSTRQIAQQKAIVQHQKIQQLISEKKLITLDAMLLGQEEERKRIASDLHDSLGSLMATIKGHFSTLKSDDLKPALVSNYEKTDALINQASNEVRRISHNMMPQALVNNGLIDALEDLSHNHADASGWSVTFEVVGMKKRLPQKHEIMIFRIFQELLANISKHASASIVLLQIIQKDQTVHLTIEDDGRGFSENEKIDGLGLNSVNARVEYLNGKMAVDSVLGEGTTITINIPLDEN